jgi:hypothetical protein
VAILLAFWKKYKDEEQASKQEVAGSTKQGLKKFKKHINMQRFSVTQTYV